MMAKIFNSNDKEEKNNFLHNYLGNLQNIMMEETKKIVAEIKNNKTTAKVE